MTGATGFAGGHLVEALLARGEHVVGLARHGTWPPGWAHLAGRVELRACDLTDAGAVEALLRDVQPRQVYHLAGYASVGRSSREPDAAWEGNLTVTRRLYDAVVRWGGAPRILFVGSGLVYGGAEAGRPLDEGAPLLPATPYAASKAAADLVSYQVTRSAGLDVVRARPFNHIGPCQSPDFAVASFARQLVRIERGEGPAALEVGDLRPQRDLTDVRDTVAAYLLLMDRGRTAEAYNVGTGQAWSMQEVLSRLIALAGLSVEARQRPELLRTVDQPVVRADPGKLRRETGWEPRFTLDQSLADTLAYWRAQPGA